ncbi:MFS domain-containing protein [Fusarium falciforme]|uniref:MFS domain-containing protein n=1 Tax=Fusarium falciforme TaxID=195108 RepID=UPI002300E3EF|nr:MFS domain-containing protein [Fusarium falciforme]WAO84722.1 MFS domain-containing protein [Fusarium falciforme]
MEKHDSPSVNQVELEATLTEVAKVATIHNTKLQKAALEGTADEHELSIRDAIRAYPQAIMWALVSSTCVIMEGYDTNLLSNFFAYPSFLIRYGRYVGVTPETPTGYQLTPAWQAGLSQGGGVGSVFGCLMCGYLVSKYGSRRVQLAALAALTAFIFVVFFAPNLPTLVVGEILCGIPWGILATTAPAYASEVLPPVLRTYMTSYTNMCFIIGQLISAGVLKGLSTRTDALGYKIPFALQWVWPVFLIPLIWMSPESPWYLVRMGKLHEAEESLRRLQSPKATNVDPQKTLSTIIYTNNLEQQLQVGTSYWDCFKGFELRRTEIACVVFAGQILCGICFAYNSSYFFSQVGLGTSTTYSLALGGTGLAFFGCLVNWFVLMPNFGRRTIYVWGMGGMCFVLILIGILNVWTHISAVAMTQACLTLLWTFIFQLSAGQLGWALPAEMGSTRLRQKTICLARDSSNIMGTIGGTLQQYFMNPQAWNLKGYTGFVWGGTCFCMFVWSYFRLPETWNRSYHELDILFAKKVPARQFATTVVDPFDTTVIDGITGKINNEAV